MTNLNLCTDHYSAAILDILIRNKDLGLLFEFHKHFQDFPMRGNLPAKTLYGLATLYEENHDYTKAVEQYEEIVQHYPEDLLAMKAYLKLSRLYLANLNEREKGMESYRKSYNHPLASDEWRASLEVESKRWGN